MRISALNNLRSRRNPEQRQLQEVYSQVQEDSSVQYLVGAMQPVEASYTQNTIGEADRVYNQIQQGLARQGISAEKGYQGSVTKNTHILAHSDIDLLVIERRFEDWERPQVPPNPYQGDPLADLQQLRSITISTLKTAFWAAIVDDKPTKCVRISGGSLSRTVDVVPCNLWRTNAYASTGDLNHRGIAILDTSVPERQWDQPFLHGAYLQVKDERTSGNTKALIRLLKSLKYDSEGRCDMSSYDIESIVYAIPDTKMAWSIGDEILLAVACKDWLATLETDAALRNGLDVPDGKRKVFATGKATLAQLTALRKELQGLLEDIENGLRQSARRLNDAKVRWPGGVKQTPWFVPPQKRI